MLCCPTKMKDTREQSERSIWDNLSEASEKWCVEVFLVLHRRKVINKNRAVCWLCAKKASYSTTPTNPHTYLLACHPTWGSRGRCTTDQMSGAAIAASSVQRHLTAYYSAHSASAGLLPAVRKNSINDEIARFIPKYVLPIGIVLGEGSQDHMMELEPRYTIPRSQHSTISTYIAKLYDATQENIKITLKDKTLATATVR